MQRKHIHKILQNILWFIEHFKIEMLRAQKVALMYKGLITRKNLQAL